MAKHIQEYQLQISQLVLDKKKLQNQLDEGKVTELKAGNEELDFKAKSQDY